MKNIFKYILLLVLGSVVLSSCEDLESNYAAMTNDYDKTNTTYYIQFANASQYFQTAIDADGLPVDIVTKVAVVLLGAPQSSDIVIPLSVNSETTIASDAYTLSANSITIPAGKSSGSVELTAIADKMIVDETVKLVLDMDAGGAEATMGTELAYELKRILFCPLEDPADMAGTYSGTDDWGVAESVTATVDGTNFMLEGVGFGWLNDMWGEPVQTSVPFIATMLPDGGIVIEEQEYVTTTWDGAPYDYSIVGSGMWDNCKKTLHIEYDLHNTTDGYYLSGYGYAPIILDLEMQ